MQHAKAAILNLTTAGSSGIINGAIYEQNETQPTGTGFIDSFVRLKPQGNGTTSKGYNTTVNNVLNNDNPDNFNHSITLSQIPRITIGGISYRRFLLDANESSGGGDEFLSLDEVQIFVGGAANGNVSAFTSGVLNHPGTLVYRMDAGADSWVALDYSLGSGSGSGDMWLYVPSALFAGFGGGSAVVTLYSEFGQRGVNPAGFVGNFGASAGFEEWAVQGIPEPATSMMVAIGLAGIILRRRR